MKYCGIYESDSHASRNYRAARVSCGGGGACRLLSAKVNTDRLIIAEDKQINVAVFFKMYICTSVVLGDNVQAD